MKRVGEALEEAGFEFDVVATSPVRRAKESAAIVSKALKRKGAAEEWGELAPEGDREALYRRLANLRAGYVLCVGHEPYLTTTIGEVISKGAWTQAGVRIALKKSGIAKLSVTAFTPRISGELRWLLTPKQIRKLA